MGKGIRAAVVAALVGIAILMPSTSSAASRSKVTLRYEERTTWHMGSGGGLPRPFKRYSLGLGYDASIAVDVPSWARLAKVWVKDDSGRPVRAVAHSSFEDYHNGWFCSPGPRRVALEKGAQLYVAVDEGIWLSPAVCPVSAPTKGTITIAFYSSSKGWET